MRPELFITPLSLTPTSIQANIQRLKEGLSVGNTPTPAALQPHLYTQIHIPIVYSQSHLTRVYIKIKRCCQCFWVSANRRIQVRYLAFVFCRRLIVLSCGRSWKRSSTLTDLNATTLSTCPEASQTCWRPASACSWRSNIAPNHTHTRLYVMGSALSHPLHLPSPAVECLLPLLEHDLIWQFVE